MSWSLTILAMAVYMAASCVKVGVITTAFAAAALVAALSAAITASTTATEVTIYTSDAGACANDTVATTIFCD